MAGVAHSESDQLLDYAYGELAPEDRKSFEAHLRGCPDCTQALGQIRGVRKTMARLTDERAPQDGLDSLMAYAQKAAQRAEAEAHADAPPRPSWWKWAVPLLATATAIVIGGVVQRVMREVPYSDEEIIRRVPPQTVNAPEPEIAGSFNLQPFGSPASDEPRVAAAKDSAGVATKPEKSSRMREEPPVAKKNTAPAERRAEPSRAFAEGEAIAGSGLGTLRGGSSPALAPAAPAPEGTAKARMPAKAKSEDDQTPSLARLNRLKAEAARNPERTALEKILVEWCDLAWALGRLTEAREPCERVLQEFPRSAHASRIRDRTGQ